MNRLKNLNTLKLVFPCLPSRLQWEKQLLKAPGFSAWSKLEVFPKRLAHAWKRLVVRRGSWRCVTDTGRMRTPSTYGSVGMGRYGHGPSKRKLPTSHCASTWRLCQIINSWPLRNFLILFSGNTRDLAMQIGWFVQIWYHLVSLSLNGHRFPSSSTCHQGYRWVSFNAMVRCWVSAVKTHCQFSWPGSTWACHKLEGTWSSLFWRFTSLCANVPKRIDAGHPFRTKHPSDPSLC